MGAKFLNSKAFYGGIGANVQETFAGDRDGEGPDDILCLNHAIRSPGAADPQCDDYLKLLQTYYPLEYSKYMPNPSIA